MIKTYKFIIVIFAAFPFLLNAQSGWDALRYSYNDVFGTARSQACGGAFSAVGGDLSTQSMNPAGLGIYQFSDLNMTSSLRIVSNRSDFMGQTAFKSASQLSINNAGYVYFNDLNPDGDKDRKWQSVSFGLTYNQSANYKREIEAEAYNPHSSITDFFVQSANGTPNNQLESDLYSYGGIAYYTYAIDTLTGQTNAYFPAFNAGRVQQKVELSQSGRKQEWNFGVGANYDNKLYLGANLGIAGIKYGQNLYVGEEDINQLHTIYQNNPNAGPLEFPSEKLDFNDRFNTSGSGVNFSAGVIYRPVDQFRIGVSVKTPTFFFLTDNFDFSVSHTQQRTTTLPTIYQESEKMSSVYRLRTPYEVTTGLMYLFGKRGFISADVNITDYQASRLRSQYSVGDPDYYSYESENAAIREGFKMAVNYRLGGELRLNKFRIRAGGNLSGNAITPAFSRYQDETNIANFRDFVPVRYAWSAGAGWRGQSLFIDLAYVQQHHKDFYRAYTLYGPGSFTPTVLNTTKTGIISLTGGIGF